MVVFWRHLHPPAHHGSMQDTIPVTDFQNIVEQLCRSATDDFVAARLRLERLRRDGPATDAGDE